MSHIYPPKMVYPPGTARWPQYLVLPHPVRDPGGPVPNLQGMFWPTAQFAPRYLPPGSVSFQPYNWNPEPQGIEGCDRPLPPPYKPPLFGVDMMVYGNVASTAMVPAAKRIAVPQWKYALFGAALRRIAQSDDRIHWNASNLIAYTKIGSALLSQGQTVEAALTFVISQHTVVPADQAKRWARSVCAALLKKAELNSVLPDYVAKVNGKHKKSKGKKKPKSQMSKDVKMAADRYFRGDIPDEEAMKMFALGAVLQNERKMLKAALHFAENESRRLDLGHLKFHRALQATMQAYRSNGSMVVSLTEGLHATGLSMPASIRLAVFTLSRLQGDSVEAANEKALIAKARLGGQEAEELGAFGCCGNDYGCPECGGTCGGTNTASACANPKDEDKIYPEDCECASDWTAKAAFAGGVVAGAIALYWYMGPGKKLVEGE